MGLMTAYLASNESGGVFFFFSYCFLPRNLLAFMLMFLARRISSSLFVSVMFMG